MSQEEFTRQIEKHKAILDRNNVVSIIAGYIKTVLLLIMVITLYFSFATGFPTSLLIAGFIDFSAFALVCVYHANVRKRMSHSKKIIALNRDYEDRILDVLNGFSGIDAGLLYGGYQYPGKLNFTYKELADQSAGTINNTVYDYEAEGSELRPEESKQVDQDKVMDFPSYIEQIFSIKDPDGSDDAVDEEEPERSVIVNTKAVRFLLM